MKVDVKELNRLRKIGENMNVSKKTIRIWEKNLKQNYRFFQPHNAYTPTPRTEREALGYTKYYLVRSSEHNLAETGKAYLVGVCVMLILLALLVWQ